MTEGEARRQDDVAGARAETERYRVSVDCPDGKTSDTLAHQSVGIVGPVVALSTHDGPLLPCK